MRDAMIHIVEDDEAVRSALHLLMRSFGWCVCTYDSAEAFLENSVQSSAPDCLLLDLDLPGMNGAELVEALAAKQSEVPVIVLTGQRDSQLAARARRAGALEVLEKPLFGEKLIGSIERALADGQRVGSVP